MLFDLFVGRASYQKWSSVVSEKCRGFFPCRNYQKTADVLSSRLEYTETETVTTITTIRSEHTPDIRSRSTPGLVAAVGTQSSPGSINHDPHPPQSTSFIRFSGKKKKKWLTCTADAAYVIDSSGLWRESNPASFPFQGDSERAGAGHGTVSLWSC